MNYNFCITLLFSFLSVSISQAQISSDYSERDESNTSSYALTKHMEETNLLLSELDSIRRNIDDKVEFSLEDVAILRRLKVTSNIIPLDYNSQVKSYIDKYTSTNYKPYMDRLYGLSKYYFQVYDKIFGEMGIPEEVKYLSLVESSLNPHLVSTSGAVGPWQFIYTTARIYNLEMNAHIDERKDIYSSTYAVSKYLSEAYDQFNDWLLALASYNCGKGCVQRAIQRSGMQNPTFWELSPYLPKETQNYIPKYVAMTYVLSNASLYNIDAIATELNHETKLVMIDKTIDLHQVAAAIQMDLANLKHYNPAFKKNVINGTLEKPKHLYLPLTPTLNDSLLYLALNSPSPISLTVKEEAAELAISNKYKVRKGETLSSISRKFGVTIQDLKAWNGLRNNSLIVGKTLVVAKSTSPTLAQNIAKVGSKSSNSRVAYYIVKKGDSLDKISRQHEGSTVKKIQEDNGLKNSNIKPGMKLKIRKG